MVLTDGVWERWGSFTVDGGYVRDMIYTRGRDAALPGSGEPRAHAETLILNVAVQKIICLLKLKTLIGGLR